MSTFRMISIGACLLFVAWFAFFGGEVFLPILDRESERLHCRDCLAACHPNELRLENYIGGYESQKGRLDLSTGNLTGDPVLPDTDHIEFWQSTRYIIHPINFPMRGEPYREDQLAQIKAALAALTPPPPVDKTLCRFQAHIAFSEKSQLRIHDYPKAEAGPALSPLFKALGFSLLDP